MSSASDILRPAFAKAYRQGAALGAARVYAGQARALLRRQFAYDQANGGPSPQDRMREVIAMLKAKLSPEELQAVLGLLLGQKEPSQLSPEQWEEDDLDHDGRPLPSRGGDAFRRSMPHAMDERSRKTFDAAYPGAKRLDGPPVLASTDRDRQREQEYLRCLERDRPGSRRGDGQLAMDADAARTSFDEMFITGRKERH